MCIMRLQIPRRYALINRRGSVLKRVSHEKTLPDNCVFLANFFFFTHHPPCQWQYCLDADKIPVYNSNSFTRAIGFTREERVLYGKRSDFDDLPLDSAVGFSSEEKSSDVVDFGTRFFNVTQRKKLWFCHDRIYASIVKKTYFLQIVIVDFQTTLITVCTDKTFRCARIVIENNITINCTRLYYTGCILRTFV